MTLGIVILNWNQVADTIACVKRIEAWPSLPRIVWVVDNASAGEEQQQITRACPEVRLIASRENRGFAGGNNLGLEQALAAGCEEILLLNNDAVVTAVAVEQLQNTLRTRPHLGMVGPMLWDGERLLSAGGRDIGRYLATHITQPLAGDEVREVAYVPGTCILLRAETLRAVGLLDEAYFFSGEIADLCARARQHGYASAVVGHARASHRLERSSQVRRRLHIYYTLRNRFLFVRKFHARGQGRLFLFWTGQSAIAWLAALRTGERQRARAIRLACIDGWRGRFGNQNARVTRGQIK